MKKVLITGITGFAGSHLKDNLLSNKDINLFGTDVKGQQVDGVSMSKVDLTDKTSTEELIKDILPDYTFHLAALASPAKSFNDPYATIDNNIKAEINLLEALRKYNQKAKILIIGSGDEYGLVYEKENPITENQTFRPTSPYSVSKIAQDMLGYQYFVSFKMQIVRVRPFNHIGPRQTAQFMVPAFARQIAEIETGIKPEIISVGNLSSIRDFTDVSDMAKAYWLAIEQGAPGEVYNIGSGNGVKTEEILNSLLSLSVKKIKIQINKDLFRPSDNPVLICNADKFRNLTGWKPEINLNQSLKQILDYWRGVVRKEQL